MSNPAVGPEPSSEVELVLLLCRTPFTDERRDRAIELCAAGINWQSALSFAEQGEVHPAVYLNLDSLPDGSIPPDVRARARSLGHEARAFGLSRALLTLDVVAALEQDKVEVLCLKGAALAQVAYGDSSLRTYRDVDLLVKERDLERARTVLLGLGYQRDYDLKSEDGLRRGGHALEFSRNTSKVELHHTLTERYLGIDLDRGALWNSAADCRLLGNQVRTLDHSRTLLFLCVHGTKHEWPLLRWVCDIAQTLDQMNPADFEHTIRLARAANSSRLLSIGLELARLAFDAHPPKLLPVGVQDRSACVLAAQYRDRVLTFGAQGGRPGHLEKLDPQLAALVQWTRSRERLVDRVRTVGSLLMRPGEREAGLGRWGWLVRAPLVIPRRLVRLVIATVESRRRANQQTSPQT